MKKVNGFLLVGIIIVGVFAVKLNYFSSSSPLETPSEVSLAVKASSAESAGDFSLFLAALADKESGGDPNAVCDDGCGCVGLYQITKGYVDDVNKILGRWEKEIWSQIKAAGGKGLGGWFVPYSYEDRKNPEYAEQMVEIYLTYYGGSLYEYENPDWSAHARIHHGGPNGDDEEYTKGFGEDVVRRINFLATKALRH